MMPSLARAIANGASPNHWRPCFLLMAMPWCRRCDRLHASLARALLDQAVQLRQNTELCNVGLTGGVFQNRPLTEQAKALLDNAGFQVRCWCRSMMPAYAWGK